MEICLLVLIQVLAAVCKCLFGPFPSSSPPTLLLFFCIYIASRAWLFYSAPSYFVSMRCLWLFIWKEYVETILMSGLLYASLLVIEDFFLLPEFSFFPLFYIDSFYLWENTGMWETFILRLRNHFCKRSLPVLVRLKAANLLEKIR